MAKTSGLTDKQQRFVDEYLVDLNASAAARRAGYSEKTAGHIAKKLVTKSSIAQAIAEKMQDLEAAALARDICREISSAMQFPGQIRVTVVREMRITEYAR